MKREKKVREILKDVKPLQKRASKKRKQNRPTTPRKKKKMSNVEKTLIEMKNKSPQ